MKLEIESWMAKQQLPSSSHPLLLDAIACYKARAYRSALITSYLSFLGVIKNRLMTGNKPPFLPIQKWTDKIRGIQDEDSWEAEVSSAIQKKISYTGSGQTRVKSEDPFFMISDGLRQQVTYWKDRRNDCAHNKDNLITNAHVEAFWAFYMSNLHKFTIEGGMASLVNKIATYYDPNQTPTGTPIQPLLQEIETSVDVGDLADFWQQVFAIIDNNDWFYERANKFTNSALQLQNDIVVESLVNFLKKDEPRLLVYIDSHPEIIQSLGWDPQTIRQFWKTKVPKRPSPIKIYASMLRNNLIPTTELNEANEHFARLKKYTDDLTDHVALLGNNFGQSLYNILFKEPDRDYFKFWEKLNDDAQIYRKYVEMYPLDEFIVQFICEELSKSWHSYFLAGTLNDLFQSNAAKKNDFLDFVNKGAISIPVALSSLQP